MSWKQIYREGSMHNFEDNKTLEGAYTSKEENQGAKGNSTVHHLRKDGGEEVAFWGSTVVDGKLASVEKHYGFGAKVKITYKGKQKGKTGTQYHDFDVEAWVGEDTVRQPSEPVKDEDIPVVNEEGEKIDLSKIPF